MEEPQYRERVKKRVLNQSQPELIVPSQTEAAAEQQVLELSKVESGLGVWLWTLAVILIAIFAFSIVDAYLTIVELLQSHILLGAILGLLLLVVVIALGYLFIREWRSVKQLNRLAHHSQSIQSLKDKGERDMTLKVLAEKAKRLNVNTLAYRAHHGFQHSIKPHHSNDEILQIYQDKVQKPLLESARAVLKQESVGAGAIAFISPNALLQTLGILWVSMRTLKRVAYVYGVRPSLLGNIKLFRIALENLAASSLTDLLTDEMANQLGGTIGDKILANSADAITAASLNQRLGKALIKELNK